MKIMFFVAPDIFLLFHKAWQSQLAEKSHREIMDFNATNWKIELSENETIETSSNKI